MIEDSNDTLMPSLHVICIASLKIMSHGIAPDTCAYDGGLYFWRLLLCLLTNHMLIRYDITQP